MKRKFLLTMFLIAGAAVGIPAVASAETPFCTNASLHGKYTFTAQGTTLAALGLPGPLTGVFASSGTADFDGKGHFELTATSSFAGVLQGPATVTGSYSVNSDCSYTSQASNGATFRAVIVDHGRELLILQTNQGVVITGTAQAQDSGRLRFDDILDGAENTCNNPSFAGSYGFLAQGYAGAPTLPEAPFAPLAGVGVVNVNRNGTFTMSAQRSVNGTLDPAPLTLTGTFSLSGCTAQLVFDVGFHFTAVLNKDEAVFIETDPGTALIVRSKRI